MPPQISEPFVEACRLERLASLEVMDTEPDPVLDRITALAASLTGSTTALVSLVDEYRQWWKSASGGLPQGGQTDRAISFCTYAIAGDDLFEVSDARLDSRFATNPLVLGHPHIVHYAGMPLKMPGGERIGTLCVINHSVKTLSPASRAALESLAELVVEMFLLRERDKLNAEALAAQKANDRQKDEFLATLAHELRNPLAPIASGAKILCLSPDPTARRIGEIVARQSRQMEVLVDDLLDISRITRGLVELQTVSLDLREVVHGAVEQVTPLLEAKQQRIALALGDAPLTVRGDSHRLTQVIANLINNAIKFTPDQGFIQVRTWMQADTTHVEIKDNGLGIEAKFLPHVFELFAQAAEASAEKVNTGLGLGLALVKSLIELHGGSAQVSSAGLGQGTTFTLTMPRDPLCRSVA